MSGFLACMETFGWVGANEGSGILLDVGENETETQRSYPTLEPVSTG